MDVLAIAASIGLDASAVGSIDERVVLDAIDRMALEYPAAADRCAEAAHQVRSARSAGAESVDRDSVFASRGTLVQLRYRTEMLDVFVDLAIDLALMAEPVGETPEPAPVG